MINLFNCANKTGGFMKYRITILMLSGLMATSAVNAAFTTTTLNVSTTIGGGGGTCTVSASGINFPYVDGNTVIYANGSVTANCSTGTSYSIALDGGLHFSAVLGGRRQVSGSAGSSIAYQLSSLSSLGDVWGDGVLFAGGVSIPDIGTGADQVHTVYGAMDPSLNTGGLVTDVYSDTVNVTVNY
jgi:spore coat protein U-like protein